MCKLRAFHGLVLVLYRRRDELPLHKHKQQTQNEKCDVLLYYRVSERSTGGMGIFQCFQESVTFSWQSCSLRHNATCFKSLVLNCSISVHCLISSCLCFISNKLAMCGCVFVHSLVKIVKSMEKYVKDALRTLLGIPLEILKKPTKSYK
jgi:hypothetical protein